MERAAVLSDPSRPAVVDLENQLITFFARWSYFNDSPALVGGGGTVSKDVPLSVTVLFHGSQGTAVSAMRDATLAAIQQTWGPLTTVGLVPGNIDVLTRP